MRNGSESLLAALLHGVRCGAMGTFSLCVHVYMAHIRFMGDHGWKVPLILSFEFTTINHLLLYTLIVFKFAQTIDSRDPNLRDSNLRTQGLKSAQTQISTILKLSTYFYFNLNANNSVYSCHKIFVDPFLEIQRRLDFDNTQIGAVSKFAHPLLREFQYCANFNTIKV